MTARHARTVALAAILVALAVGAQAQTPEIDAVRARAEQGHARAQFNLGVMYATGGGVPQDDAAVQPRELSAGGWERDLRLRPAGVTPRSESRLSPILVWRRG